MRSLALALVLAVVVAPVSAHDADEHDVHEGDLTITQPMSGPVLEGRTAAAFMEIANEGDDAERLVGASSPAFDAVELHESVEEDGVSKMRPLDGLEIPAGEAVTLEHGGMHMMLIGAKQRFGAGDAFPLTLDFEHAGRVEVTVEVGGMSGHGDMEHSDDRHHHDAGTTE